MDVRGDDFNQTPYEALAALFLAERGRIPRNLWEPYAGNGRLVVPLRRRGYSVFATDLVDRGCPDARGGMDFFQPLERDFQKIVLDTGRAGILSNPPFDNVEAHIELAVARAPYVAFLLRFAFLESERGHGWFGRMGLTRVHLISERLPMMHRDGYDGPKIDKSAMPMAWFIFERKARLVPSPRRVRRVDLSFVSYRAALKKYPFSEADEPPAAIPNVPGLLRLMAAGPVNSGDNGDKAPAM